MAANKKSAEAQNAVLEKDALQEIFENALTSKASDLHIEPMSDSVRIRFRLDGILREQESLPISEYESIINRIKVLSGLDIMSHPVPQDGHFELPYKDRQLDVRVSIFPTVTGEAIALRILNRADTLLPIKGLEMDAQTANVFRKLISRIYGMVLVTGPSGSGKTTTLYAILRELQSKERNIITLEDPVELRLEGIRQSQIRADKGYTFAVGMRSILRQDPDAIMIGEIRDPETAEYAMRASLAGRIVFSTVHANSSVGTIARLLDMNIERSLIAYAVNGIISKRLVRRICKDCLENYTPEAQYLEYFGIEADAYNFTRGKGCNICGNTGYIGRLGIFEVLEFDDNIRHLIIDKASTAVIQEYVEKSGVKTLKQDALEKVLAGLTTLEEVARAV